MGWLVSFMLRPNYPLYSLLGGLVDPKGDLKATEKRKISCPYQEPNHNSSAIKVLYRLVYRNSSTAGGNCLVLYSGSAEFESQPWNCSAILAEVFSRLSQSILAISGIISRLWNDRFLPNPLQFINYFTSYTIWFRYWPFCIIIHKEKETIRLYRGIHPHYFGGIAGRCNTDNVKKWEAGEGAYVYRRGACAFLSRQQNTVTARARSGKFFV